MAKKNTKIKDKDPFWLEDPLSDNDYSGIHGTQKKTISCKKSPNKSLSSGGGAS